MTFTPGPWHRRPPPAADNGNPWVVQDMIGNTLAIVTSPPREANARLIAAAPELLAVAQRTLRLFEAISPTIPGIEEVRAIIAKATGHAEGEVLPDSQRPPTLDKGWAT